MGNEYVHINPDCERVAMLKASDPSRLPVGVSPLPGRQGDRPSAIRMSGKGGTNRCGLPRPWDSVA